MRHRTAALICVSLLLLTAVGLAVPAAAQTNVTGQWTVLSNTMPINPVHVGLMHTGKILVVAGSENDPTQTIYRAGVYDPGTSTIATQTTPWDLFCNGLSWLPDGRALITGGNLQYNPFRGIRTTTIFDPATEKFIQVQDMARGRWYPSNVALGDGRTATFSGWMEGGGTNNAVEIYSVPGGWSPQFMAPFVPPLYPWLHLLPNGRVFMAGASIDSSIFNPATNTWQTNVARTNYTRERTYGSSVLLPLSAADSYRARIMIMGGDNPATASAEIIDLSQATPSWRTVAPMSAPRIQMNAVLLPTGKVLALGGSEQNNTASTASLNADLFDPATETWSPAGRASVPRMYHSVALLLPDGTVWTAGSNPQQGTYEKRIEIYRPAYLFAPGGGAAARPSITTAPDVVGYNASFQVSTPNAASIASVALMRNGADTHAFDMDQRMVSLSFTRGAGSLTITAPPNANVAPPGYYMLFLVDTNGVPSIARFVQVSSTPGNQPPRGTITDPAGDVTIRAGQSVTFAGSATDADGTVAGYRWIFPGGSPATSTSATPGAVTFNTPGTYHVSLTATDNQGVNDPSPPMRIVTVQSAALTASFTSPAEGSTVNGTVSVGLAASGASGSSNTYTLRLDGTQVFSTTAGAAATFSWNTQLVADGPHTLALTVTDSSGATATATRALRVDNATPPGKLSVSFPNLTPGQTVTGTVPVQIQVGGTTGANNRFSVSVDGGQPTVIVSNSTTVTWNWDTTTVANGSRTLSAAVEDAAGNSGTGFVYVQVQNTGLQVTMTQPKSGATVSGTAVWTTIWVAGAAAGTKTYTLSVGGQTLATGTSTSSGPVTLPWNSTSVANGPQTLTATVRDPQGAAGSGSIPVTVQNAASALSASFSAPAAGATVSGTTTVTMAASGGTAPYTYTLTIDGTQVASGASTTFSWNTTSYAPGGHTLGLTVRDSAGATATATRAVSVQNGGGPTALTAGFSAPAAGATVSGSVSVGMVASGGTAPYTYTLTIDGTQVASGASTTFTWNTTTAGDGGHTLGLTVRDNAGGTATATRAVTVQNNSTGTLNVGLTAPKPGATVSGTVWITAWVDGGAAGAKTYTVTVDGVTVWTATTDNRPASLPWRTTDGADGTKTAVVNARDAAGAIGSASVTVIVQNGTTPPPPPGLTAGFSAPGAGATVSGTTTVSLTASGGTAPYTYTLTIDGTQVASSGSASFSWNTTTYAAGTHTLGLTVRDSAGGTATASRSVTVQNGTGGGTLVIGITAPKAGATVSGTVWVTIWVDGAAAGTKNYTMKVGTTTVWTEASANRPTTLPWRTTDGPNGTQTLVVTATDSAGATGTGSVTVTVANP